MHNTRCTTLLTSPLLNLFTCRIPPEKLIQAQNYLKEVVMKKRKKRSLDRPKKKTRTEAASSKESEDDEMGPELVENYYFNDFQDETAWIKFIINYEGSDKLKKRTLSRWKKTLNEELREKFLKLELLIYGDLAIKNNKIKLKRNNRLKKKASESRDGESIGDDESSVDGSGSESEEEDEDEDEDDDEGADEGEAESDGNNEDAARSAALNRDTRRNKNKSRKKDKTTSVLAVETNDFNDFLIMEDVRENVLWTYEFAVREKDDLTQLITHNQFRGKGIMTT